MPATDHQGSFGRHLRSLRRDQVHSVESMSQGFEMEVEVFQKQVTEQFLELSSAGSDELLSISWIRKLLDAFICCHEEFRMIMLNHKSELHKAPMDRLMSDFFERTIKALDVCNAIRDGIDHIRQWSKLMEIVVCALDGKQRTLGEGQFRRAKKALVDLAISMLDDRDSNAGMGHRNRSFGRNNNSPSKDHHHRSIGHSRSLSWSVSRSWSASRQLQAIGNSLSVPRASDISATNGLALSVYTMGSILLFVMWVLVASIPCQDRGLQVHFFVPRQFTWAAPMMSLHERIFEESKKRDRKNSCGLLKEIHQIEKSSRLLSELADFHKLPLADDNEREVRLRVEELRQVSEAIKEGLDPLERQVREVFHRIVRSRTEGLDSLGNAHNPE